METLSSPARRDGASPSLWVPTLYFAEGLPFWAVNMMALIFYSRMGVSNTVITATVSLLALPWTLKPLWSPFLEMFRTKKFFVVLMELVGGLSLGLLALCPREPHRRIYRCVLITDTSPRISDVAHTATPRAAASRHAIPTRSPAISGSSQT